jgi:putative DNA primase/helicase
MDSRNAPRHTAEGSRAQDEADGIQAPRKRRKSPGREPQLFDQQEIMGCYAVVYGTDQVLDTQLMIYMKSNAMRLAVGAEAYKVWFADPAKRVVLPSQIVFDPSEKCGIECINLFKGLSLQPVPGDCAELLGLLMHLISDSSENDAKTAEILNYILDWMAYPLQFPGAKMATALVFHGPQGTGKNLFWEAYARIFGDYASVIGQAQLESKYNDWASGKLFLIGDEIVAPNEQAHQKNALKSLVTGETIQIEVKFQPLRSERNHANFVFLSNDNKPMALERDDRRHLVVYCPAKRTDGLYERVRASFECGAVEALYAMLMKRDLGNFHTHTPPVMTRAKADLVELGLRPAEQFTHEWLSQEVDLPLHPCSTAQLYKAFKHWCRNTGERLPPHQRLFSSAVAKYARDRLTTKKASPSPLDVGSTVTLWLPAGTGPVDGVRWFDFARECIAAFESPLSRYLNGYQEQQHDQ